MVRIAIDCPTDFIEYKDDLLYDWGLQESIYPEILITNPGSEYKYDEQHFNDEHYQDLKIVATPSTGNTHIDLNYLDLIIIVLMLCFFEKCKVSQTS